jgi:hypothetical protein
VADSTGIEGRKTIFATLGGALSVAGLALVGSAIGAIVDAPAKRNLTVEWVLLGLAVAMIVGGTYVFVAAMSERLWLPGMNRVREAVRDHAFARMVLTRALARGQLLTTHGAATDRKEITAWWDASLDFILGMWGRPEMTLIAGGARKIPLYGKSANEIVHPVLLRMESFLARCHKVPLLPPSERKSLSAAQWRAMVGDVLPMPTEDYGDVTPPSHAGTSDADPQTGP